jgi:phosphoenolpyruvate carboxykinase (GTP)
VLKWVFERIDGTTGAVDTAIGRLPSAGALDLDGLDIADNDLDELLAVDTDGWLNAIPEIREHLNSFAPRIPAALPAAVDRLERELTGA